MAAPWSTPVGCRSGHEGPLRVDSGRSFIAPDYGGWGGNLNDSESGNIAFAEFKQSSIWATVTESTHAVNCNLLTGIGSSASIARAKSCNAVKRLSATEPANSGVTYSRGAGVNMMPGGFVLVRNISTMTFASNIRNVELCGCISAG
jgi:hypothetical protein